jgi:hypothetical protein
MHRTRIKIIATTCFGSIAIFRELTPDIRQTHPAPAVGTMLHAARHFLDRL